MSSSELIALKSRFINLKKDIKDIIFNLNKSIEHSSNLIDVLMSNYKYDDIIADKNFNNKNKENIEDIISTLNNSVIPAIEAKISELKRKIRESLALEGAGIDQ